MGTFIRAGLVHRDHLPDSAFSRLRQFPPGKRERRRPDPAVVAALEAEFGYAVPLGSPRKTKRSNVSRLTRERVFMRDAFVCQVCGREFDPHEPDGGRRSTDVFLTLGHIIPTSVGGLNALWNLRAECSTCNLGRGDELPCKDDFAEPPPRAT